MAKTKKKRPGGKPRGMNYADMLARKRMIREAVQKALWLAVCSVADAYGFGPERMKKFFIALQENNDEITRMEKEVDTDYAYEKLRLKAERVTGMKIEYLYEHEAQDYEG